MSVEYTEMDALTQDSKEFVTVYIADQLFGIPVEIIHDVFQPQAITEVPLSGPEVGGVLNLRGKIVTALDVRHRLGLEPRDKTKKCMAVGIEKNGESYGILIDRVGEVLRLSNDAYERNPANLDSRWREFSKGIYRLEGELLVIFDVELLLDVGGESAAA
jgi:purine-binding chemotaxis protein CheW